MGRTVACVTATRQSAIGAYPAKCTGILLDPVMLLAGAMGRRPFTVLSGRPARVILGQRGNATQASGRSGCHVSPAWGAPEIPAQQERTLRGAERARRPPSATSR